MTPRNLPFLLLAIAILFAGVIYFISKNDRPITDTNTEANKNSEEVVDDEVNTPTNEQSSSVSVYVVELEAGSVGCGDKIVAINRNITPTQAVLQASLQELLSLLATEFGPQEQYYNSLASSSLQVDSAIVTNGVATVSLSGQVSVGGVCDEPRFVEQIKQTVMQFPTVNQANITVNGTPLDSLFSQGA